MSSQPSPPPARSTRDAGTFCACPSETTLYEVVHCARSTTRTEETTYGLKAIPAPRIMSSVPGFVWHTHRPCKLSYETRTVVARAVVVARHGADDLVERGDDEDDARRCRSDAGPRPRAALAAAERLRVTVDAAGADIARGGFPNRPFLYFTKMKVAISRASPRRSPRTDISQILSPRNRMRSCPFWLIWGQSSNTPVARAPECRNGDRDRRWRLAG